MSGVRAGAAVVVGRRRIISPGFSRTAISCGIFSSTPKIGERLVADLMTLNPVTVHRDKLAVEVLNLLERHRIDDLDRGG